MIYYILLTILINLCILNLLILDFNELLININDNINTINIYIKNIEIKNKPINNIYNKFNKELINLENNNIICNLDCKIEINKIVYFYDNISQFKNIYHMIPLKIEKKENNQCLILYINQPIINNKYNKTNMFKDKRLFTFNYFDDNLCNWYITELSISLWNK